MGEGIFGKRKTSHNKPRNSLPPHLGPPTSLSDKIHNSQARDMAMNGYPWGGYYYFVLVLVYKIVPSSSHFRRGGWAEEKLLEASYVDPRCLAQPSLVRSEPTTYIMPRRHPEFTHMCAAISAQ
ncbi:hypothetical protein PIB30_002763 [Stylosanthes scabra]|uniref:Uncharacterized protein n=1 Tax=Stylosanthes scabra TaxID=79078 RepID=A0ABU6S3A4_9FABA|nr:hypothetical protein [Stylosanthes scabra]